MCTANRETRATTIDGTIFMGTSLSRNANTTSMERLRQGLLDRCANPNHSGVLGPGSVQF
jgi:hypothetical protein